MNVCWPIEMRELGPARFGISWNDGHVSEYSVRNLRLECRCAGCVDEWTREKTLKEDQVPQDIGPKKIETVGRYALHFVWSDGHDTGIYTFEHLRSLCECHQCKTVSV